MVVSGVIILCLRALTNLIGLLGGTMRIRSKFTVVQGWSLRMKVPSGAGLLAYNKAPWTCLKLALVLR